MPTSQKADVTEPLWNEVPTITSVPMGNKPIEDLLSKEWLLTNSRGGYASSTIIGCNTKRYHGLLIGSLTPPTNRITTLANCLEMVIIKDETPAKVFNLSTFEFNDKFAPEGFKHIRQFRRDAGVHFDYQLNCAKADTSAKAEIELTKSVYLCRDADMVWLLYDFTKVGRKAEFTLRPLIALRDFHSLQKSYAPLHSKWLRHNDSEASLLVRHDIPNSCELLIGCENLPCKKNTKEQSPSEVSFEKDEQWWFNFVYRDDKQRGQDFTEDLWTPGFFKYHIDSPSRIIFQVNLSNGKDSSPHPLKSYFAQLSTTTDKTRTSQNSAPASTNNHSFRTLCLAAEQFITSHKAQPALQALGPKAANHKQAPKRNELRPGKPWRTTILAGYPWFADWGRDTFVALPGLLLSTGRFNEAKSVLVTFAQAADEGMIPNRFDDNSDTAYFNSVDASFWFINAAFQYLYTASDINTFMQQLLPTIHWIIDSYYNGTRFGIRADADELITAGNNETQLTWMDAKCNGVVFTPRCGKAVEVNALWYNSLCWIAKFYAETDTETAKHFKSIAERMAASFCKLFWNETVGYLNDCILPDGSADASLRPNQIFAVSLAFSPLSIEQQKSVVNAVQKNLLTPYGLRTLHAADKRYKGTYTGPQQQRDEAYHQGTVWPYLMGPFVEAYLKVNNFSKNSKRKAAEFIQPLMQHLTEDGCLGQVSEIFDGDAPHKPRGCIAQAWSVAELIRAYKLVNS